MNGRLFSLKPKYLCFGRIQYIRSLSCCFFLTLLIKFCRDQTIAISSTTFITTNTTMITTITTTSTPSTANTALKITIKATSTTIAKITNNYGTRKTST